jgi:hypothetical protein
MRMARYLHAALLAAIDGIQHKGSAGQSQGILGIQSKKWA